MNPQLCKDRKFLLMFLRSERFNVSTAAKRMLRYFDSKRIIFGDDKLGQRITYDDLDENDRSCLKTSSFQVLRSKDQTGRAVAFAWGLRDTDGHPSQKNYFRGDWYQLMSKVEEDEEIQRKGFVVISYQIGVSMTQRTKTARTMAQHKRFLTDSIPARVVGVHFCYDAPHLRPMAMLIQNVASIDERLRFRAHYGSHLECQYDLMRFGIPQDILPVDNCGRLKKEIFLNYIYNDYVFDTPTEKGRKGQGQALEKVELRENTTTQEQAQEQQEPEKQQKQELPRTAVSTSSSTSQWIRNADVTNNDVLLGKGAGQWHPGNVRLTNAIQSRRNEYEVGSKFEKTCIAMVIVRSIRDSNGRFLERPTTTNRTDWQEVSDFRARRSIINRFRNKGSFM